ncbi:MAG: A/G-specific adenine glycosylase [Cyanobacteria bacterium HKST-UBA03]|nr:A/G-specific adenine glycosylase [Cyanobacteria bacterium HKST-UBA03]
MKSPSPPNKTLTPLSAKVVQSLRQSLIAWFKANGRSLPWRETRQPYAVWLSEIMLQQTQVNTVVDYYHRFLARFPSIVSLADAPQADVLKQWEGLGYYSRARNLHKAAQLIRDQHHGVFPTQFDDIVALPGIGQSTAGAIATFALMQPRPILDGNVKRVLARLMAIDAPIQEATTAKTMWPLSARLLPDDPEAAWQFNQALMELGATCCTLKNPDCSRCPWQKTCQAYARNLQGELPVSVKRKPVPHHDIGVAVLWKDETRQQCLIALRPQDGLLGGLWEFPGGKREADETLPACVAREIMEEIGIEIAVGAKLTEIKHAYTHFKVTLHVYDCLYVSGTPQPKASQALQWVTLDEMSAYAFPKANNRIIDLLKSNPAMQLTLC